MLVVGQNKVQTLLSQPLHLIPHSIVLCGESGSGRRSLCQEFAARYSMSYQLVESKIDSEFIDNLVISASPSLVVFDGDKLAERDQNSLLKLIEEPGDNIYCIVITECVDSLLPTIKSRCQIWNMESYTREQLQLFTKEEGPLKDLILDLAHTPGQVQEYQQQPVLEMYQFAEKVVDNIDRAAIANTLMITDRIAFKNEKQKYNLQLFGSLLLHISKVRVLSSQEVRFLRCYDITNQYLQVQRRYPKLDRRELFEHYLVTLWRGMRDGIEVA